MLDSAVHDWTFVFVKEIFVFIEKAFMFVIRTFCQRKCPFAYSENAKLFAQICETIYTIQFVMTRVKCE